MAMFVCMAISGVMSLIKLYLVEHAAEVQEDYLQFTLIVFAVDNNLHVFR